MSADEKVMHTVSKKLSNKLSTCKGLQHGVYKRPYFKNLLSVPAHKSVTVLNKSIAEIPMPFPDVYADHDMHGHVYGIEFLLLLSTWFG
jgi:hypothetical protein